MGNQLNRMKKLKTIKGGKLSQLEDVEFGQATAKATELFHIRTKT